MADGLLQISPPTPFEEQGFIVRPRLFAFDEIAWVRDEARIVALRRGQAGRAPAGQAWTAEAPAGTVYGAHLNEATFRKLAAHPRLIAVARDLLGEDVYVHQSRLISRFEEASTDIAWRRDFATWSATDGMATPRAVTAAIVLGESGPQTPIMYVAPGSHGGKDISGGGAAVAVAAPFGSVVFYRADLAYAFNQFADRRSSPLFLVSYSAASNLPVRFARDEIYAARRAAAPIVEADDCMWPASWCAAG